MTDESHSSDSTIFTSASWLIESRRRARYHQRWAIALCLIGSAFLLAWEFF